MFNRSVIPVEGGNSMTIETIETQNIVNRLINILGKNINIMNKDGTIIASGDKSRIGDFHGAAKDAIDQKSEVIVNENNQVKYEGSKSGVNIPIYYKGEAIGVVGITGEPAEVKGYGLIVKELVELMIQEEERRNFELFQSRAIKNFARELVKYHGNEDYAILSSRAKLIQFDAAIPRILIAINICDFSSIMASYKEDSEVMAQKLKQEIVDSINVISNLALDVAVNIIDDHFVIFKSNYSNIDAYCEKIEKVLQDRFAIKVYIGVGSKCTSLEEYHRSYILATNTIDIGRRLHPEKLIYFSKDYNLQLLLHNVNHEQKAQFLSNLGTLFEDTHDDSVKELLNTIKVYFENKMSIKDTAAALYVHRNTILYRINKFVENYGIDITNPYNCMMVYIGFNLIE
jgi:carbohydrate diacid regulator